MRTTTTTLIKKKYCIRFDICRPSMCHPYTEPAYVVTTFVMTQASRLPIKKRRNEKKNVGRVYIGRKYFEFLVLVFEPVSLGHEQILKYFTFF